MVLLKRRPGRAFNQRYGMGHGVSTSFADSCSVASGQVKQVAGKGTTSSWGCGACTSLRQLSARVPPRAYPVARRASRTSPRRITADAIAARICWCRDCQYLAANGTVNMIVPVERIEQQPLPPQRA